VVVIYAGTRGNLDNIPVEDVRRFESELLDWMRTRHGELLDAIRTKGDISDESTFETAVKEFAAQFKTTVREGHEPTPERQGAASSSLVDAETTLPEEDITREGH
jgi:hypothetical protein